MINSKVLKSAGTAMMAIFNTSTAAATQAEAVINNLGSSAVHTTAALDDLAANMHDATSMAKVDDMTRRRLNYLDKYKDQEMPAELAALCSP